MVDSKREGLDSAFNLLDEMENSIKTGEFLNQSEVAQLLQETKDRIEKLKELRIREVFY